MSITACQLQNEISGVGDYWGLGCWGFNSHGETFNEGISNSQTLIKLLTSFR